MKTYLRLLLLSAVLCCGCVNNTIDQAVWNPPRTNCTDAGNLWQVQANSWLQTQPRIHLVFWGSYWLNSGINEYMYYSNAWSVLANDPAFYKPLQGYGI